MPAVDPRLIVQNPAPLNPSVTWPYRVDQFPADTLLGQLGNLAPRDDLPEFIGPVPNRYELR